MFKKKIFRKLKVVSSALINLNQNKKNCQELKTFCMFVGYSRTGSTLVSSLLDAHPNILIANELNALKYFRFSFSKNLLFSLLIEKSKEFIKRGKKGGGYIYNIPNQWQGRFKKLLVIGDKHPGLSAWQLYNNPELLNKLRKKIGVEIKLIYIIRNPYDAIASQSYLSKNRNKTTKHLIKRFLFHSKSLAELEKRVPSDIFYLHHEKLIADPKLYLKKLCQFLEVESNDDYLNDCASIIYETPRQSRYKIKWDPESIIMVKKIINEFEFLKEYSFRE